MKGYWNHRATVGLRRQIAGAIRIVAILTLIAGVVVWVPAGFAQSNTSGNDVLPPPPPPVSTQAPNGATAPSVVARLSDVEGTVEILRGETVEFSHAVMNMPLAEGTAVRTGADGRAEIEFEDGSVARITPNSALAITRLTRDADQTLHTALDQRSGLAYYELRYDPQYPFEVSFGGNTASPTVNSTFRVNLDAAPPALAVLDGSVRVQGAASTGNTPGSYFVEVRQGNTMQFQPSANAPYTMANWIAPNGFDDWNQQRDEEAAQQAQNQTPARVQQGGGSVMDSGIGWSDLDTFGGWYPLPGYGMVWQPWGIGPGFDPYGFGMWADYGGFGYTWISGYPWGWLPFHYGLWTYIGGFGWGWMPCSYPFGGAFGYGYGGYGYGGRNRPHHYPYTNVYRGPRGYAAPNPPTRVRGQSPRRVVQVGNWTKMRSRSGARIAGINRRHPGGEISRGESPRGQSSRGESSRIEPRPVKFRGAKIAPLHSTLSGVRVPARNAALYNNYPAHAFGGNIRSVFEHRAALRSGNGGQAPLQSGHIDRARVRATGAGTRTQAHPVPIRPGGIQTAQGPAEAMRRSTLRGRTTLRQPMSANRPMSASREEALHIARGRIVAKESSPIRPGAASFGEHSGFTPRPAPIERRPAFGQRSSFGSHSSFGPRGGVRSGPTALPSRPEFGARGRSGGGIHPSGVRSRGGFQGGARPSGGFRGGGVRSGGGFHGGGMSAGGFHGGGMSGGHAGSAGMGGGHSPR